MRIENLNENGGRSSASVAHSVCYRWVLGWGSWGRSVWRALRAPTESFSLFLDSAAHVLGKSCIRDVGDKTPEVVEGHGVAMGDGER